MKLTFGVGCKKRTVDLAKIAYGHRPLYGLIHVDGRSCLQVSKIYEIETPACRVCWKMVGMNPRKRRGGIARWPMVNDAEKIVSISDRI